MVKMKEKIGGGVVCRQSDLLKKLRKKKTIQPDMIDLAEAQAQDYMEMNKRLTNIESKVAEIDTKLAVQDGKLDLIIKRLDGPAEAERIDGAVWREIKSWAKTWKFWVIIILILTAISFAGPQFGNLIFGWVPTGA